MKIGKEKKRKLCLNLDIINSPNPITLPDKINKSKNSNNPQAEENETFISMTIENDVDKYGQENEVAKLIEEEDLRLEDALSFKLYGNEKHNLILNSNKKKFSLNANSVSKKSTGKGPTFTIHHAFKSSLVDSTVKNCSSFRNTPKSNPGFQLSSTFRKTSKNELLRSEIMPAQQTPKNIDFDQPRPSFKIIKRRLSVQNKPGNQPTSPPNILTNSHFPPYDNRIFATQDTHKQSPRIILADKWNLTNDFAKKSFLLKNFNSSQKYFSPRLQLTNKSKANLKIELVQGLLTQHQLMILETRKQLLFI